MATLIHNSKDIHVIRLAAYEMMAVKDGHFGLCDLCQQGTEYGYLLPLIDSFYCPVCYKAWIDSVTRYKSDIKPEYNRYLVYCDILNKLGAWELG